MIFRILAVKTASFRTPAGHSPTAPGMKAEREQLLSQTLATPCLKPASKWYEWHIMQGNKATRTERPKIIIADDGRMKGK